MVKQMPDRSRMESLRKELGFKDPGIFEKSVYAFNLLNELPRVYQKTQVLASAISATH